MMAPEVGQPIVRDQRCRVITLVSLTRRERRGPIASNDLHQNGRLADHLIRGGDGDFAEKSSQTMPCEAQAVLAHGPRRDLQRASGATNSMVT
jgi:hypothetical protein